LKLNDLEATPAAPNLISQLNAEQTNIPAREEVKFENLGMRIQPTEERRSEVSLGESGVIGIQKSRYHNQYRRLFLISFFIILVTGISSVILRLYSRYIYFASQAVPSTTYSTYINLYKQ